MMHAIDKKENTVIDILNTNTMMHATVIDF